MEPELEYRLQSTNKAQLLLLLQELATRHPQLLPEYSELLEHVILVTPSENFAEADLPGERSEEEWDFSGNTPALRITPATPLLPLDLQAYRQRMASYQSMEIDDAAVKTIEEELLELLKESEGRVDARDYDAALDLFCLLIDTRLLDENPTLSPLLDQTIDESLPILETLLSEVSSQILFDTTLAISPLLSPAARQQWLERLFALWLKRLDTYHNEEEIPEVILDIAWSDDVTLLRGLVQKELQYSQEHTNIVDLTRQYRARALEKFLKELPHV